MSLNFTLKTKNLNLGGDSRKSESTEFVCAAGIGIYNYPNDSKLDTFLTSYC